MVSQGLRDHLQKAEAKGQMSFCARLNSLLHYVWNKGIILTGPSGLYNPQWYAFHLPKGKAIVACFTLSVWLLKCLFRPCWGLSHGQVVIFMPMLSVWYVQGFRAISKGKLSLANEHLLTVV